jgi:hypothetical protein
MDDDQRHDRVLLKLRTRDLPVDDPLKIWAGPSMGGPCDVCGEPIASPAEYELDFAGGLTVRFDRACYALWQSLRTQPGVLKSRRQVS